MADRQKKREGQEYTKLNISRTKKAFFIVLEELSFGEKIKIWWKYQTQALSIKPCKNRYHWWVCGGYNLSLWFYFMIFTRFRWGAITGEIWFYLVIPSTGHSTIYPLTMINGTLIKDIVKKDVGDIENLGTLFSHFSNFYHT